MIEAGFGKLAKFIVYRFKGRDFVQLFLGQNNRSAPPPKRASLLRYGFTLITISLALLLTLGAPVIRSGTPFILFFLAVPLSAWYGGWRAGLFAVALSILSVNLWVFPSSALFPNFAQLTQTIVFLIVAGTIVWLVSALQRAQSRLYVERLALHLTLASIGDAVIVTDLSEKVSWMNDVAASVTGWSATEAVGHPLTEVFPIVNEQTHAPVENPVRRVLAEGKIVGLANHTVLLARDGVARPIEDSAAPIRDNVGNLSGVVLIFRDITERRQAELATARLAQQVKQEQERLAGLIANVPGVVWEAWGQPDDQAQRIDFVSDYVESLLGYSKAEWLAVPNFWLSIVHPDDREAAAHKAAADFNSGEGGVNQFRWLTKDGRALYCEAVASVIKDAAGQPLGMRGITFDRTARKQAEDARALLTETIRQSEQLYRTLVEQAADGIVLTDRQDNILEANPSICTMLGYRRDEMLGLNIQSLIDQAELPTAMRRLQERGVGEIVTLEGQFRHQDGTLLMLEGKVRQLDDGRSLIILRDITVRKRVERNQQFLSEIEAQINRLADPDEIRWTAVQALGVHLGVARSTLNEVDPDTLHVTITRPWHQAGQPSLVGRYILPDLVTPAFLARCQRGYTVVIHDTATDPYSADLYATGYARMGIGGLITVPCLTEGRWVALLSVNSDTPRTWQADEVALVEAVAARVWPAIVKARAEQALRKSEAQLRLIIDHMPGLIAYVDRTERYVFVNATYTSWFSRPQEQIEGHTIQEVLDDASYHQRQAYLATALAGQPVTFEATSTYPDGIARTVLTTYVPQIAVEGQVNGFYVFVTDITERKQAEEVLARYQLLSERARDIILYIGPDARIIEANGAAVAAYGYDRATLLGMHIHDLRDPATIVTVAMQIAQADSGGILFETNHRRKDGTTFPVEVSSIGADISGERVLLSIIRDITERKQAEVDLRESEERFRATFDQAAVGMAQISPDGHYVRVNERLCEILGYSRIELLQKTYKAITHPDDLAADVVQTERLLAGEITSYTLEKRYVHKNGDSIWTTMTRSAVRNAAGVVQYGVAVIEDISARKAAEARLHFLAEASAVLTASLDYAITLQRVADLMVLHLADWCAVDIVGADGALELAAVAHVDPTKVQWARSLREQSPPDMNAAYGLPNVVRTGVAEFYPEISEELILRSEPDDEELAIIRQVGFKSVIIVPLQARGQVLGGLTLVWADSDRHYTQSDLHFAEEVAHRAALAVDNVRLYQEARQAEAQLRQLNETLELRVAERTAELRQSNEDLDRFAYVASHDLKSPLRAIDHLSNWIMQDAAEQLPAASQEHLVKLRGRVKRMERLLDDLLAYSRADRFKYAKQKVDTAVIVADVAQLVTPIEGFTVTAQAPMPVLLTERVPLELVLRNLIDNAIKHHNRAEGQVWVTARDLGSIIEFSVRDDGPGIDKQFSERIFQMFQTLRPRDQVEGSGMGLAIVKKVVESRGGTLHVESTPGRGATFRFTWPKT